MSKVKDNIVTTGLSGKLGKQIVFRHWCGATFLAKAPVRSKSVSIHDDARLLRFKQAAVYAKKAVDDPETKAAYLAQCKVRQNAYSRAVQDFFTAPVVHEINTAAYTGAIGGAIRIYATDDFRVNRVKVCICGKNDTLVESGLALQEPGGNWWKYVASVHNPDTTGCRVIVSAYDLPGNEAIEEAGI